uniref:Nucleoporin POM33 n=1 Tax=Fusarium oxysporum (strain Fo5176) TaxID=660025 RepID=A0A0D2XYT3_FUSOF
MVCRTPHPDPYNGPIFLVLDSNELLHPHGSALLPYCLYRCRCHLWHRRLQDHARSRKTGARAAPTPMALLSDENIQYLAMALVWLFSPQYPLALIPYTIYSVFHVATYTRANLIPVVLAPKPAPEAADGASPSRQAVNSPLANQIGAFVKEYYDASMAIVSSLEIALWGRILLSAILFQRRSWILIVLYTAFLRARYSQSTHVQNSFTQLGARVDSLVSAQGTPPAARQVWQGVKEAGKQFHDATDVSKYISGPAKKTS